MVNKSTNNYIYLKEYDKITGYHKYEDWLNMPRKDKKKLLQHGQLKAKQYVKKLQPTISKFFNTLFNFFDE